MKSIIAIRKKKYIEDPGSWKAGKMPKTAFPLSKSHSYQLGSNWEWRVCLLSCDEGFRYRLLVAFDAAKQQYRAWLGLEIGNDLAILARLEFHPDHKGWHCHWKTGVVSLLARGVVKEARARDRSRGCRTYNSFDTSRMGAMQVAFRVFNADFRQEPWGAFR
jgi:hypothetical protein